MCDVWSKCPKCGRQESYCVWEAMHASHSLCRTLELERLHADAPAWHDRPTVPGLWVGQFRGERSSMAMQFTAKLVAKCDGNCLIAACRWYGPLPLDTPPAAEKGAE